MTEQNTPPPSPMKRPRLVSAIEAFGVTVFAYFTIFGLLNISFSLSSNSILTLSAFISILTFISLYVLLLGFKDLLPKRRVMFPAAILPSLLIAFEAGAIITILINGPSSPFGGAVDGISGPLTNGLLPMVPWPLSFSFGVLAAAGLIYYMVRSFKGSPANI